ncbi:TetR family transcriptional regulator [Frankia sp. AgKG'84/4]|uniref:TetR family transcriptional regulator n=1 Tax=Frankia sp. AgKG'84/4 TaxID=573490 RepID=UPI00200DDDFC|nr:TetR family transcriptional regulator [Frankia sp. AgKG'84/4]MCL9793322.1 TetR family transcriptional regulator [Frankia sp. AgKG'84/4]
MGLRERKKEQTRRALASAATQLFTERGYEATTVEDIAAAAEVSPRTFFRYYPAKEDVVSQIFRSSGFDSLVDARPADEPVAETLRAAAFSLLRVCAEAPAPALAVLRMVDTRPELRVRLAEVQWERSEALTTLVTARLGAEPDSPLPGLLASWTLATVDTVLAHWHNTGGRLDLLDLAADAFDRLQPALRAAAESDYSAAHPRRPSAELAS